MKILHLREFQTACWSGGTTRELYLYPEGGSYARRDFRFRISSATVEQEESDFTLLPGVERLITPLEGEFTLTHPGRPPVKLAALGTPYRFRGDVPTHCVGRATDFNLMLAGCRGTMEIRRSKAEICPGFNSFYPTENTVFFTEQGEHFLQKGEMLVIFSEREGSVAFDDIPVVICRVEP